MKTRLWGTRRVRTTNVMIRLYTLPTQATVTVPTHWRLRTRHWNLINPSFCFCLSVSSSGSSQNVCQCVVSSLMILGEGLNVFSSNMFLDFRFLSVYVLFVKWLFTLIVGCGWIPSNSNRISYIEGIYVESYFDCNNIVCTDKNTFKSEKYFVKIVFI